MKFSSLVSLVFLALLLDGCSNNSTRYSNSSQTPTSPAPSTTSNTADTEKLTENYKRYLTSKYDVAFNLPDDWEMTKIKVYPNGYAKFYTPKAQTNYNERMIVHYFKDEKTTSKEFLKKAKEVTMQLNCKFNHSKVKAIDSQSVTLSVTSKQCPAIHDLIQVYKAFSMSDGLYTVSYRAKLKTTNEQNINDMKAIVENARIVETH